MLKLQLEEQLAWQLLIQLTFSEVTVLPSGAPQEPLQLELQALTDPPVQLR